MTEPKRIQLRRTKGWRKPEGAVVVSRPSKWGNPWRMSLYEIDYPEHTAEGRRQMAASDFRGYVEGKWDLEGTEQETYPVDLIRAELAGKDLACWCPLDQPCHADVLLEVANS